MNDKIVPMRPGDKRTPKPTSQGEYPQLPAAEQIERDLGDIGRVSLELRMPRYANDLGAMERTLTEAEALISSGAFCIAEEFVLSAVQATRAQLAQHLGMMVGAFPNARPHEPEIYGRLLIEDVGALQPTVMALEMACRQLRRTLKFLPTIADVLEAVTKAERTVQSRSSTVEGFPEAINLARSRLQRLREDRARDEDRQLKLAKFQKRTQTPAENAAAEALAVQQQLERLGLDTEAAHQWAEKLTR